MLSLNPPDDFNALKICVYRTGFEAVLDALFLAAARHPGQQAGLLAAVEALRSWQPPDNPFNAAAFIRHGLKQGPALGQALRIAEESWCKAGFPSESATIERMRIDAAAAVLGRKAGADSGLASGRPVR